MEFSSKLINDSVEQFSKLPGIGKKSALRLTLHLLKLDKDVVDDFGNAFINLRQNISYCKECHNISDVEICDICSNQERGVWRGGMTRLKQRVRARIFFIFRRRRWTGARG